MDFSPDGAYAGYNWELYNVMEDPTQFNDLAAAMPEKLKQLQSIFYLEAQKHDVLPLDNTTLPRWNAADTTSREIPSAASC